jgi:magnesium-protoporphyrin IX monomethyl ester (oxidative) cyclase
VSSVWLAALALVEVSMASRVLLVHPSPLIFSEIFLRLEPLGVECVAAAIEAAGYDVRLIDLQVLSTADVRATLKSWRPDAVGFSVNYLANVPEVIDLAREVKATLPQARVFVGGHSASFVAQEMLAHADGAIDCVIRGEGEGAAPQVLAAFASGASVHGIPGVVTADDLGAPPLLLPNPEKHMPARHLTSKRRKYFIGELDPCASIEFTRGCPWDCNFCSAWTFYGRSYRKFDAAAAGEDLASIREPNVFIVDDVAFIRPEHGMAIADEVERRRIQKRYYLETRADVLVRNREVFERWTRLGLRYMFLGIEAIDEDGLKRFRKRVVTSENDQALQIARELGLVVAINIIADPEWDEHRFEVVRQWALEVPEIVNMTISTPYPGTEIWLTDARRFTTRDYRLFDVQHAVLPTKMPLRKFYGEFVKTQDVLNKKHLGWQAVYDVFGITMRLLAHGQTNFLKMLWKFNDVYSVDRLMRDHEGSVKYPIGLPTITARPAGARPSVGEMYIHHPTAFAASAAM